MTTPASFSRRMSFRAAIEPAKIRAGTFDGRSHLVVPVVAALGNSVIEPLGSSGPELMTEEALAWIPETWSGKPVVPDHPMNADGTLPESAGTIPVLESQGMGWVFHPRYESGRLHLEAWIDPDRATRAGAGDVVSRLEALSEGGDEEADLVEVSIGYLAFMDGQPGVTASGQKYTSACVALVPDHLAVGLNGSRGACSVEMGCGAPRVAALNPKGATMSASTDTPTDTPSPPEIFDRPIHFQRSAASGISDENLRNWLRDALRSVETRWDYLWVEAVYDDVVIYGAEMREGTQFEMYERAYTIDEAAGSVTLGSEVFPVRRQVSYEREPSVTVEPGLVAAATRAVMRVLRGADTPSPNPKGAAECGCSNPSSTPNNRGTEAAPEGDNMSKPNDAVRALVGRLIACEHSPFTEADQALLEGATEERLTQMLEELEKEDKEEAEAVVVTTGTTPATPPATPPAEPTSQTQSATDPEEDGKFVRIPVGEYEVLQEVAATYKATQAARRTALTAAIRSCERAAAIYDEKRLAAMSIPDLEALAQIASPKPKGATTLEVDYSGQGVARASTPDNTVPPPPKLADRIAKRRGHSNPTTN